MNGDDDLRVYGQIRRELRVAKGRVACLKRFLDNATRASSQVAECLSHYRRAGWDEWPGSGLIALSTDPKMPTEPAPTQSAVVDALDEYALLVGRKIPELETEMAQVEDALNAREE